jgi:glutathione S-transferase
VNLRLYVVPASHPCAAVEKALELKGLPYKVWEWLPPMHAPMQLLLTGRRTVPSLKIDGENVSGSRAIMHRLDELAPEPALYPNDPAARARVETADLWGDETVQPIARELIWAGATRRPEALVSYGANSRLPVPGALLRLSAPLIARAEGRLNRTDDELAVRRLAELPSHLERIDAWLADGTLGGADQPNAADLQILSTVRLLATMADVRPLLKGRPCEAAARQLWPELAGDLPAGSIGRR